MYCICPQNPWMYMIPYWWCVHVCQCVLWRDLSIDFGSAQIEPQTLNKVQWFNHLGRCTLTFESLKVLVLTHKILSCHLLLFINDNSFLNTQLWNLFNHNLFMLFLFQCFLHDKDLLSYSVMITAFLWPSCKLVHNLFMLFLFQCFLHDKNNGCWWTQLQVSNLGYRWPRKGRFCEWNIIRQNC